MKRFDFFGDAPFQVNQLDFACPLNILTDQQKRDTLESLERSGTVTQHALRFVTVSPKTYII